MRRAILAIERRLNEEPRVIVLKPDHRRLADGGRRVKEQVHEVRDAAAGVESRSAPVRGSWPG